MYTAQTVKDRIKFLCKRKKVDMEVMLSELSLGVNAIRQINDAKGMGSFSLAKIADYLNVSVDYLLGRTDEPNSTLIKSGDINGNNNSLTDSNNINISKKPTDSISEKFMEIFNNLPFEEQLAVMNFAMEKYKNERK